jgi:S-DNA-T family DNA segregation ATPase FtsK/SpoIIIE
MFEHELAPGVRLNKIIGMSDDLAVALKVPHVRVVAPIPGKSSVGIEVPNQIKDQVRTKEFMTTPDQPWKNYFTPLFLGKDVTGMHVVKNLEEMPHLLVAGTTGSGKSVCLNCIILSLLLTRTPDELKLILIDPKMVEMTAFRDMPHLHSPVVTDMKKAPTVLDWAVRHMEERYDLMARAGVKKIATYNSLGEKKLRERLGVDDDTAIPITMPRIIVVIDELADLRRSPAPSGSTWCWRRSVRRWT